MLKRKIFSSSEIRSVTKNYGWLVFDKVIRLVIGLYISTKVARYLGPQNYGALAYVTSCLIFIQAVVGLGLEGVVVRYLANAKENSGEVLGTVTLFRLVAGVCAVLIIIVWLWLGLTEIVELDYLIVFAAGGLIFQAADTIDLWFQSQGQSQKSVVPKIFAYVLSGGLKLIAVFLEAPLFVFAILISVEAFLVLIGLLVSYRLNGLKSHWSVSIQFAKKILPEGVPYMLTGLSSAVYMRIDQMFIEKNLGSEQLGYYAAATLLSSLWHFLPVTLVSSLNPYFSKLKYESEDRYISGLNNAFKLFFVIGLFSSLVTYFFSGLIVSILFGEKFSGAVDILNIYVFTNVFICFGLAQTIWIVNEKKGKLGFYRALIGALASVGLNYIFIDRFGISGVVWAAVVSQALSTVFSNIIFAPSVFRMQMRVMFFIWK